MTYTSCIRIVEKACGKTCQISQINCYVSVITVPRNMTYHFNLRITRWLSTFKQRIMRKNKLYLLFKNTIDSGTWPTNFKYINFGTTYHRQAHFKDFPTKNKEGLLYTENTLHWRKIEMGECSSPVTAVTHPAHPCSWSRLSYLLRQFLQSGKILNKTKQSKDSIEDRVHRKAILFSEINCVATASPYQIACAAQFPKLSSLAAAASS